MKSCVKTKNNIHQNSEKIANADSICCNFSWLCTLDMIDLGLIIVFPSFWSH